MKISAAAKRLLYDIFIDYTGKKNWYVWAVSNAEGRELVAHGLIDKVDRGWHGMWVITRDGWEVAESIHAEKTRLDNGVPMAEFKPTPIIPLHKDGWVSDGAWHTNGHLCAKGAALNTEIPGSRLTVGSATWDRVVPNGPQLKRFETVEAVGFTGDSVYFSNAEALNPRYYSHIVRLFPKCEWRHNGKPGGAFAAVVDGCAVGVVMPFRTGVPPAGIRTLINENAEAL